LFVYAISLYIWGDYLGRYERTVNTPVLVHSLSNRGIQFLSTSTSEYNPYIVAISGKTQMKDNKIII
jgi:hypothetical protein